MMIKIKLLLSVSSKKGAMQRCNGYSLFIMATFGKLILFTFFTFFLGHAFAPCEVTDPVPNSSLGKLQYGGASLSTDVTATGGTGTYSIVAISTPDGLSIVNAKTISGTPPHYNVGVKSISLSAEFSE